MIFQRFTLLAIFMQIILINECMTKKRLCGEALYRHLIRVCTFGYETMPCFKSRFTPLIIENVNSTTNNFHRRAIIGIANQCCKSGCTVLDLRTTCCFKLSCLTKCYPKSNYEKRIRNVTNIKIN
ncbi:Nematode insulin-related peptide beta type family protein [Brugia pahangi]